jgi:peptidoglycan-associated lipoprotein
LEPVSEISQLIFNLTGVVNMNIKKWILILGATALLAACGSSVKLDKAPVEDRTGTTADQIANSTADNAIGKSSVPTLEVGKLATDTLPVSSRLVYFDYDSFVIKAESQSLIESNARLIKADKNRKVVIEGHTDERGGREYNLALGQKRAEAVRRALGLLGVADSQMEAVSFGKEKPMSSGSDEAALAKNRRAEISYR